MRDLRNRLSGNPIDARAFARRDLLAIVAVAALGIIVIFVEFGKLGERSHLIYCNNNLKQIGMGFRTWELDHGGLFPMAISTNSHGSREHVAAGGVFRHFQVMSNELSTPRILVCPGDSRRFAATFDQDFSNSNLSYFVGVVSNSSAPQMFLTGDRNITGGRKLLNGSLEFGTNDPIRWRPGIHKIYGNIGLADGSVQTFNANGLQNGLKCSGDTNFLAIP